MQARSLVGSALLAAGMLLAGCGGAAPVAEEPQEQLVSQEEALPDCTGKNYENEYYSDASYTTLIGSRGCSCGAYFSWGRTSTYRLYYDYGACW
ncbi:MAG TPA: hypothetical protein VE153_12440 [Myxococcus sp.]|nr:hypothetical protein [Myxococcus sp.]